MKTKLYEELLELNRKIHDLIIELSSQNLPKDINSGLELMVQQNIDSYYTRAHASWELKSKLKGFIIRFDDINCTIPVVVMQGENGMGDRTKYFYRVGKRKLAPLFTKYEDIIIELERNYEVLKDTLRQYSEDLTYSDVKRALNLNKLEENDTN